MQKKLKYYFNWNQAEANKFALHYKDNWVEKANQTIRSLTPISIPEDYEAAILKLDPEAKKGQNFAIFTENEIPNPWDFDKNYQYAFSFNFEKWYKLEPLTPWIWESQKEEKDKWHVPYGLNNELVKMIIEKEVELNTLKVVRFRK